MTQDLHIEKDFATTPETLFLWISEPSQIFQWFGPEGTTLVDHHLHWNEPGPWRAVMEGSEGQRNKVSGVVFASDQNHKVIFSWAWHDEEDNRGPESLVTLAVAANDKGGARLSLLHTGLADEEAVTNHRLGWASSLGKFNRQFAA